MDAAWLYRALARVESNAQRRAAERGAVGGAGGAGGARESVAGGGSAGGLGKGQAVGSGGYVAAKVEAEGPAREVEMEREELRLMPDGEEKELALILEAKGL